MDQQNNPILSEEQLDEVSGGKDSGKFVSYTVKHGDTLTKIAHHYKTSVSSICRHNSIIKDRNFIVSGWVLTIPDNR